MGILEKILGGNILYYPGCMTKFVLKDLEDNYEKILRNCGIDFIKLKDLEVCCGSPVLNAGYEDDFKTLANKNSDVFKKHSIKKVITSCPACYKTFYKDYPKVLGEEWNIEVEHTTQTISQAIKNRKLKIRKIRKPVKVTYHDPCHLGRHCGIYEEPREILEALGYKIVEMRYNRENALCCGGGGGLKSNYPELSEKITKDVLKQAKDTKSGILVTACPMCYACFKKVAEGSRMKVMEISELIIDQPSG